MTISLRLSEEENMLFKQYASLKGVSVSEMVRETVVERIEDEYDLKAYENAMKELKKDSEVYSHEEVGKMLGLTE